MENFQVSPHYCQYVVGKCDQNFLKDVKPTVLFLFPNEPEIIASTVEAAAKKLGRQQDKILSKTWKDLNPQGQIIFCEICKVIRECSLIVADITTLNFNLLFEIGFAIGLGKPVLPIRDTNYEVDKKEFEELGILDTLGYYSYSNSQELVNEITSTFPRKNLPEIVEKISTDSPLYYLKGSINTDGAITFLSTLKKSPLKFRTFDPLETTRLSLFEARKQVSKSIGIFSHLFSENRKGAKVHNALCAFVSGLGMSQQKVIAMVKEEYSQQPIDYRDIVTVYSSSEAIRKLLERPIYNVVQNMQSQNTHYNKQPEGILQKIDLGNSAAENEIMGLREYFVATGQFNQAKQGHARLVTGRKGTGKTATFYEIKESIGISKYKLTLDLKPEGHQFVRLKETIFSRMTEGVQEHTIIAFWNYILLIELAHKIIETEYSFAEREPHRFEKYNKIKEIFDADKTGESLDFSQRLLYKIERISEVITDMTEITEKHNITQLIYSGDIKELNNIVCDYLKEKDEVWLLFDNIDKGWPTRGATQQDIIIVRGLLSAARKLQSQLESRGVNFICIVFLRTDIYELLLKETPDKGKDSAIQLDWDDPELFKEIILRRIRASIDMPGNFSEVWQHLFFSHIETEDSFSYIIDRTLMRPRDLLEFLQKAIQIALNRGHEKVSADDILQAEKAYSDDLLIMTSYEIEDTQPKLQNLLYAFQGVNKQLTKKDFAIILKNYGILDDELERIIEVLLWFGFIGVFNTKSQIEKYSYMVKYNLNQLLYLIEKGEGVFVIHPSFRSALEIK